MFGKLLVKGSEWTYRIIKANVMWVLLTLMGGIFLGIFPATLALAKIVKQWQDGDVKQSVHQTMWQAYKTEFKLGTALGAYYLGSGILILINLRSVTYFHHLIFSVMFYMLLFAAVLWFISLAYLFPIAIAFEGNAKSYIKQTMGLAFYDVKLLLIQLVGLVLLWYLTLEIPALLLFGTMTLWQIYTAQCTQNVIKKLQVKESIG